jgi:hypothetical protein
MATAQARLAGRFPPGTEVTLVEVGSAAVARAEGGREVDRQTVGDDGVVTFSKGVEVGGRYFAVGDVPPGPRREVRIRGNVGEDAVNGQAPIQPDRVRLSDGSWSDEAPKREKAPFVPPGPRLGQHQVPEGTPQRSDTPTGVATPIPVGDSVEAWRRAESSQARESRGDWTRAHAEPLDAKGVKVGKVKGASGKKSAARDEELRVSEREASTLADLPAEADTSGLDAEGQPVSEDVAAAAGVESADKPAEPVRTRKPNRRGSRKTS